MSDDHPLPWLPVALSVLGALLLGGCALIAGVEDGVLAPPEGAGASGSGATSTGATSSSAGPGTGGSGGVERMGYAAAVLADMPIAYYRFDEEAGTECRDASANGYHGSYVGDVLLQQAGATADGNHAATFAGRGEVATFDDATFGGTLDFAGKEPFSIEVWVKPSEVEGLGIVGKSLAGDVQGFMLVTSGSASRAPFVSLRRYLSAEMVDDVYGPPLEASVFTHLVATFDGTVMKLYIDGAQAAETRTASYDLPDTDAPLQVGAVDGWGSFAGTIDELAIYGHALPPAQISAHIAAAGR